MKFSLINICFLGAAITGFAQELAPRHEIGLTLGRRASVTRAGATGVELQPGTALQANYGIRLAGGNAVALYGEVHFLSTPQQRVVSAEGGATRDVATVFLTPGLRLKFLPARAISPYVAAGGGWALFEHSLLTMDGRPNPAPRLASHGVFAFGGGVDVKVWRWLGLRAEVRDFYAGSPTYNVAGIRGGQHNLVAGGGIVLRFP